jgi:hypothetical protein
LFSILVTVGTEALKFEVPILAKVWESDNTVMAMATAGSGEAADNRVTGLDIGDALSDFLYIT